MELADRLSPTSIWRPLTYFLAPQIGVLVMDQAETMEAQGTEELLQRIGAHRKIYPVFWASMLSAWSMTSNLGREEEVAPGMARRRKPITTSVRPMP